MELKDLIEGKNVRRFYNEIRKYRKIGPLKEITEIDRKEHKLRRQIKNLVCNRVYGHKILIFYNSSDDLKIVVSKLSSSWYGYDRYYFIDHNFQLTGNERYNHLDDAAVTEHKLLSYARVFYLDFKKKSSRRSTNSETMEKYTRLAARRLIVKYANGVDEDFRKDMIEFLATGGSLSVASEILDEFAYYGDEDWYQNVRYIPSNSSKDHILRLVKNAKEHYDNKRYAIVNYTMDLLKE